jgi:hypothetical protein
MSVATATVKGGFWPTNGVSSLPSMSGKGQRRRVALSLDGKGTFALREIVRTLDGAVAGTTATKTFARVEANVELGGKRVVETETLVNRATTAADVTETKADLFSLSARTTKAAQLNLNRNPLGSAGMF